MEFSKNETSDRREMYSKKSQPQRVNDICDRPNVMQEFHWRCADQHRE